MSCLLRGDHSGATFHSPLLKLRGLIKVKSHSPGSFCPPHAGVREAKLHLFWQVCALACCVECTAQCTEQLFVCLRAWFNTRCVCQGDMHGGIVDYSLSVQTVLPIGNTGLLNVVAVFIGVSLQLNPSVWALSLYSLDDSRNGVWVCVDARSRSLLLHSCHWDKKVDLDRPLALYMLGLLHIWVGSYWLRLCKFPCANTWLWSWKFCVITKSKEWNVLLFCILIVKVLGIRIVLVVEEKMNWKCVFVLTVY